MTSLAVSRMAFTTLVVVVLLIGFGIGFLAGYLGCPPSWKERHFVDNTVTTKPVPCRDNGMGEDGNKRMPEVIGEMKDEGAMEYHERPGHVYDDGPRLEGLGHLLQQEISKETIKEYLREMAKHSRLPGTTREETTSHNLRKFFESNGLDVVKVLPYDVFLSYPDELSYGHVELYDRRDKLVYSSTRSRSGTGNGLPREAMEDPQPFFAYSARGSPKGDLVYVNYATVDDFMKVTESKNIDISSKICIARIGKIHTSNKVANAERFGAAGLLLYKDILNEAEADPGKEPHQPTDIHSNSLLSEPGDPLTPGYPAIGSAFRLPISDAPLPKIPVHPIRFKDAQYLMGLMRGEKVEEDWRGNLNVDYRYGPGFKQRRMKIQIKVSTDNRNSTIHNTLGIIRGTTEQDRYVLISSHHDGATSNSVHSSSGTAIMMELVRAFGKMLDQGWRPIRSIVFCSWSASDYGLIGSTEWVEHYRQLLMERAVAVVNLHVGVQGNYTFNAEGTPIVHRVIKDVSKNIMNPDELEKSRGRTRVYDTWNGRQLPSLNIWGEFSKPRILPPDTRSDAYPFISQLGVTAINLAFLSQKANRDGWPLSICTTCSDSNYHELVESIDIGLEFHLALTRYASELTRRIADNIVLPFDVRNFAKALQSYVTDFTETHGHVLKARGMSLGLGYLQEAVSTFQRATDSFADTLVFLNKSDPIAVRMINDRLMGVERSFIDPHGQQNRPNARHILYSGHSRARKIPFPGLADSLAEAEESTLNSAEKWEEVRRQLSLLSHFIHQSAAVLKPVDEFF